MGVKRKFSSGLLGTLLPFLIIDAVRREAAKLGYRQVELSWILEDNLPMRRINEALEGKPYKTYRIYDNLLPCNRTFLSGRLRLWCSQVRAVCRTSGRRGIGRAQWREGVG